LSLLTVFTFVFGMGTGVFRSLGHQECFVTAPSFFRWIGSILSGLRDTIYGITLVLASILFDTSTLKTAI
jgi:hypothetical protein